MDGFEKLQNPELQEKLKMASTPEELLAVAREEGYELTDEELSGVAGGWCNDCSSDGQCGVPYWR